MGGPEFFQTLMGKRFYEGTMPSLVRELNTLNKNLGRIAAALDAKQGAPDAGAPVTEVEV